MGSWFYIFSGIWALAVLGVFIQAIRLSYRIEGRSPELENRSGIPRRAMMLHTVTNWKVARDEETQELRRRMNRLLLVVVVAFALFALAAFRMREAAP